MDPTDLSAEQREQIRQAARFAELQQKYEDAQEAVHREAKRQSRWIEEQIWTTDYSDVAVLDVVTYLPIAPGQAQDIKVYRYPTADDAPPKAGYAERSNMQAQVQRVHRDEFARLVEEEGVEPPPFVDDARVWEGDHGPDDDTEREGPDLSEISEEGENDG